MKGAVGTAAAVVAARFPTRAPDAVAEDAVAALTAIVPAGFEVCAIAIGAAGDRHACGREAARRALDALGGDLRLAYVGTRPIVVVDGPWHAAISITHTRSIAVAVAARVDRLGIDLCDDDPRLVGIAKRFLVDELPLAGEDLRRLSACFAAKEAALKALGVGLIDGGVLDGTAVRVVSLDPPRLSEGALELALGRVPGGAVAVVHS